MAWGMTHTKVDNFDYAIALGATPGMNGWTVADTSAAGTPTYVGTSEDGGSVKLTCTSTSEAQNITLHQNDVVNYDLDDVSNVWWVAKVSGVDAVTVVSLGVGSAQADDEDDVATNAWFKIEGATSTSAVVCETDDGTTDNDDKATGKTLAAVYKRFLIDFSQGLSDVRFFIDGERVAAGTTFDMSSVSAGTNVQPYAQVSKASGTGTPALQIAQFGITYKTSYGA